MTKTSLKQAILKSGLALEGWFRPKTLHPPEDAECVLVLEFMLALGSCVHVTPLYEALKRGPKPKTVIVATRGLGLQVLRHSPFVDHLIETPDPLTNLRGAIESLRYELKLRNLNPDCCLTGAPDQRTTIALLGLAVCNGWRGGYSVHPDLYHHPFHFDKNNSQIFSNLQLAGLVGCPDDLLEPRVFCTKEDQTTARTLLQPIQSGGKPTLVVVSRNSGGQRTGWHEERWVESLRYAAQIGYNLVMVGTAGDAPAIQELIDKTGNGISMAGKTNISQLASLIALSDLLLSLDTGTMHVGRAVGTPMVVLGPSWQKPQEWLPLGKPHVRILRGEDRADIPPDYQLDEITVDMVKGALDELTHLYPRSEAERESRLTRILSDVDLLAPKA